MNGKVVYILATCLIVAQAGLFPFQLNSGFLQPNGGLPFPQFPIADASSNAVGPSPPVSSVLGAGVPFATKRITPDGQERVFLHPGTPPRIETRESVPITEETEESPSFSTPPPVTTSTVAPDLTGPFIPENFGKLFNNGNFKQGFY
ncbi:hypothetical protein GWI33_019174 [Rhynchophorus ferrugineus]|uniref:Uncharacterized protein n=1 Tax=Rhynchophorus ferrugineus TaxID=354439 RepID=A0A834M0S9_RHYFE|nr:hypothetical protein GWI33_019174 [Rhynchophorus ferrugineus]